MSEKNQSLNHAGWTLVTPEMATAMLNRMMQNRTLSGARVSQYARDMKNKRWTRNPSPICIAPSGELMDGQHRLWAVIESDTPVLFKIEQDVPEEVMESIDTGRIRTFADLCVIQLDQRNATAFGAAVRLMYRYDNKTLTVNRRPPISNAELKDTVQRHPMLQLVVSRAVNKGLRTIMSPASGVFVWALLSELDEIAADNFMQATRDGMWPNGAVLMPMDMPFILRNRLVGLQSKARRTDWNVVETAALTIKAWNAWRRGRPLQVLRWRTKASDRDEQFPVPV